ncbi:hypothetical protein Q3G72_005648 [Acer saccharum]|nr:hypothetical protein Q3G72_005648 [Acer saccharum]
MAEALIPLLQLSDSPRIVNVSSSMDFKEGSLETKGWPHFVSAYSVTKVVLAKKYPNFCINCVCPGYVKTDINRNTGILSVEEGAASPVRLMIIQLKSH